MSQEPECPFCKQVGDPIASWGPDLVWQFPNSLAFLGPWQFFTGYCLLVSREHATELSALGSKRAAFLNEMATLAEAIEHCFRPLKLNYELLGNVVPHLHWHIFPRSSDDPNRLRPVWLELERASTDESEAARLRQGSIPRAEAVSRLQARLQEMPGMLGSPGE
jgi:diadenosine tetraphosphate (Ap4A) HIT family hydrolase